MSAQAKPRAQRARTDLERDMSGVIFTHNARTAKIQELVASRGTLA